MPPRTRMTPEQVATITERRRVAWSERHGIALRTKAEQEELRQEIKSAPSSGALQAIYEAWFKRLGLGR